MSLKYLELDSTYRDRNQFPLSSQFIVSVSESGTKGKNDPIDPISDASPVLVWNNSFAEGISSNYIDFIWMSPTPFGIDNRGLCGGTTFQCQILPDEEKNRKNFRQVRGFYIGCNLCVGELTGTDVIGQQCGTYPPVLPVTQRRIIDYQPLDNQNAIFTIESPFPDSLYGISGFYIQNPGTQSTDINTTIPKIFIPYSNNGWKDIQKKQTFESGTDNYYINYSSQNTDLSGQIGGELYNIVSFDFQTRLATLDKPTPSGVDFNSNINNFVLRKQQPIDTGIIPSKSLLNLDACVYGNSIQLKSDNKSFKQNISGDFIRIKPSINQLPPWSKPVNEEKRIKSYIFGEGEITSIENGNMVINLGNFASNIDNYYKDGILSIIEDSTGLFIDSAKILSYNSQTKKAVLSNPLIFANIGSKWYIRTIILNNPFSTTLTRNYSTLLINNSPFVNYPAIFAYEIESWTRENSIPFNLSFRSHQQSVCYEVELINLILPNISLTSGRGGRPIFYPYFYVQFQPISDQSSNKFTFSSNNPNSFKALFRALNTDTSTPIETPFIKIDGDGMKMIIKFKFSDSFLFSIYHPEGDLVTFDVTEQFSPTQPNAANQISACFSFRRIE